MTKMLLKSGRVIDPAAKRDGVFDVLVTDATVTAIGRFALAYADQAEADHAALKAAVRAGHVEVFREA